VTEWSSFTQGLGSLLVAFYNSQGYSVGVLTHLHMGKLNAYSLLKYASKFIISAQASKFHLPINWNKY
jgi:hypothetical protein